MIPFSNGGDGGEGDLLLGSQISGTGKPQASAEDKHWQKVRLLRRLG